MSPIYLVLKLLHVVAAIVFMGWFVVAAFWKAQADRNGDPAVLRATLDGLRAGDRRFVMPAVVLLLVGGFGAQGAGHVPITDLWIAGSIVLFLLATFASMGRLVPLQKRMLALLGGGSPDRDAYARLSGSWRRWNLIATLSVLLAVILMVFKPH
jgi:uncharacterized membrane protein